MNNFIEKNKKYLGFIFRDLYLGIYINFFPLS